MKLNISQSQLQASWFSKMGKGALEVNLLKTPCILYTSESLNVPQVYTGPSLKTNYREITNII